MLKLFKSFFVFNLGLIVCSAAFGKNIVQVDSSNDLTYQPYPLNNQVIKVCCNAQGDGAYCSGFGLSNSIVTISSKIACILGGVKLPNNYFPTNCSMQKNGFCSFSVYPNQQLSSAIYKNVGFKVVTNQNIQYYQFLNQVSATGWPNSLTPSLWGFDGHGFVNFNQPGNFLSSQLVAASPIDACSALTNASEVSGKIVLIKRGTCEFGYKGLIAQTAGAIGVVIYNNTSGYVNMGAGTFGANVTIPLLSISQFNGQNLFNLLSQGQVANVSMGNLVV